MVSQDLYGLWEELHFWQDLLASAKGCKGLCREGVEDLARRLKKRIRNANRGDGGSYIELVQDIQASGLLVRLPQCRI